MLVIPSFSHPKNKNQTKPKKTWNNSLDTQFFVPTANQKNEEKVWEVFAKPPTSSQSPPSPGRCRWPRSLPKRPGESLHSKQQHRYYNKWPKNIKLQVFRVYCCYCCHGFILFRKIFKNSKIAFGFFGTTPGPWWLRPHAIHRNPSKTRHHSPGRNRASYVNLGT